MPLHTTESTHLSQLSSPTPDPKYLIFFASGTPSWCPDCREALPAIHKVFGTDSASLDGPHGYMILVGERAAWKDPANHFRKAYDIHCVPTIVKWSQGKEIGRLEDVPDCANEATIKKFIEQ